MQTNRARALFRVLTCSFAVIAIGSAGVQAKDPIKATLVGFPAGDPFSLTVENAARAEAEASGVDLVIQRPQSYELSSQVPILNAVIASKPDVILVDPVDAVGVQDTLNKAKSLGIKIILWDNTVQDPSVAETFVSSDPVELGRSAAKEFHRRAGGKTGSVFYQGSMPSFAFFQQLRQGWEEAMTELPGYKHLPITYSDFEAAKASSQMEATLAANPDLIGGFAGTIYDQQGIVPAAERAGKVNDLILVGVDGAPENVDFLRAGKMDALVSVRAADYGVAIIKATVAVMAGEKLPANTVIGQCVLRADNLDDPENKACLYERPQ
jgi:ribose transport system substrate-binding protein